MKRKIYLLGAFLFFFISISSPLFAYPNKAYELFDYNEKVAFLGTIYYDAQPYNLYQVGDVYAVLNPSGDIATDPGIIQNVIFVNLVLNDAGDYKQTYIETQENLEGLESVINDTISALKTLGVFSLGAVFAYEPPLYEFLKSGIRGEFNYEKQLSISKSLSSRATALVTSPSYDEAVKIREENKILLKGLLTIRGDRKLQRGADAIYEDESDLKKIPFLGGAVVKNGKRYTRLMDSINANLEEVQGISYLLSNASELAAMLSLSSIERIKSKQKGAGQEFQVATGELSLAQDFIEDLHVKTFLEPPREAPLQASENAISNVREMIRGGEYNSAINDIEDARLQITDAKFSSEDASILMDLLEFQVWKINGGISIVDEGAKMLSVEKMKNLSIAETKNSELKTNLSFAEKKFLDGDYRGAKKIAHISVVDSIEVISMLDSLISDVSIDDGGDSASAGSVSGECGYYGE